MRDGWVSVSRSRPCPICGKPDNCKITAEGDKVYCGRVSEGSIKQNAGGQWLHILKDDPDWRNRQREQYHKKSEPREPDAGVVKLAGLAEHRISDQAREQLAVELGLSPEALGRMATGWATADQLHTLQTKCQGRGCWTFPMRSSHSDIIGIRLRSTDGFKYAANGSMSGLFVPRDLGKTAHNTLVITEGPTDCAAVLDMGFDAIGRPSNTGGMSMIAELVRSRAAGCRWRQIVVLIDRDSTDEDHDGERVPRALREFFYLHRQAFGERLDTAFNHCVATALPDMLSTAQRTTLTGALTLLHALHKPGRLLRVMCPPPVVKDARDWLRRGATEDDLLMQLEGEEWPRLERPKHDGYRKFNTKGAA
ncbi:MAG: hypothetical protein AAGI37_19550 [Planctomycetota bacterium]